jgi:phosphoribosyl 1,2-cyclic phosphodiesterase/CheY-like chemotaxis protein
MRVRFWGTRGSLAKPGAATLRYGGNTSCVQIVSNSGILLVIDCGTGGHELGMKLVRESGGPVRGHMLISHTHWDHIQGIPFFAPFFVPGGEWDLYAPQGFGESLRETLAGQMEYTYFPVTPDAFAAELRYHNLSEGAFRIGDITIRTRYLNHPALTLGYRIEADGAALVYACDHEPHSRALAFGEGPIEGQDLLHADFLRGADLVIHDTQFCASEYAPKVGWGHATHEYAVRLADAAGVKRLALTHHDPMRSDAEIDAIVERARASLGADSRLEVFGAAEGPELELVGTVPEASAVPDEISAEVIGLEAERPLLLLVTADRELAEKMGQAVASEPLEVIHAGGREGALDLFQNERPGLVIIDDELPEACGAALSKELRALANGKAETLPIMIVGRKASPDGAGLEDATDWIQAPFSAEFARARIRTWMMRGQFRWIRATIDEQEAERLAALRSLNLLDTRPEERFDRFTRIAAALFDTPVSLVTLVDENRQWFKSCIGTETCETSREVSFCAHALKSEEVLVVPDALADPRFADNPLVTDGPRIRFYAGAPLRLSGGLCVGTLCVLDTRPRLLSEKEIDLLRDMAALVEQELIPQPVLRPLLVTA